MTMIAFCVGNILGPQTFRASQAPGYIGGKVSIVVTLTCQIFVCFALRFCNDRLNKKNQKALEGMGEDEKSLLKEKLAYADETDRKSKSSPRHVLGHDCSILSVDRRFVKSALSCSHVFDAFENPSLTVQLDQMFSSSTLIERNCVEIAP
jgi:hypothetical protein